MAYEMVSHGQTDVGMDLQFVFERYLRLENLLQVKVGHVKYLDFSSQSSDYATMNIIIGKTGWNEMVTSRIYLVAKLLKNRVDGQEILVDKVLFPYAPSRLRAILWRSADQLALPFEFTLHMLQFGDTTKDKLFGRLRDQHIKYRGRRQSDKSFKLYKNPDRL